MPSLRNGEYQAVALAEPRTCKAQSIAKTDSPTCAIRLLSRGLMFIFESTRKLKGPTNYKTNYKLIRQIFV
jgi:hypothetical protein